MFLSHYDKSFISCNNSQMNKLVQVTKILFKLYNKNIIEANIINAIYENDDIYYSSKFLFKSKKSIEDLHSNYCNLAKLIYIFYNGNRYPMELDSMIDTISNKQVLIDLLY